MFSAGYVTWLVKCQVLVSGFLSGARAVATVIVTIGPDRLTGKPRGHVEQCPSVSPGASVRITSYTNL